VMKAMGAGAEEPAETILELPEEKVPTEID
jgi:hypothetical protein